MTESRGERKLIMCRSRLLKIMLLMAVTIGFGTEASAYGVRRHSYRGYRTGRPSRSGRGYGGMANAQSALRALNAAQMEQLAARRNLVQTRSRVNELHDNSKPISDVNGDFKQAEDAYHQAQDKVRDSLKASNTISTFTLRISKLA